MTDKIRIRPGQPVGLHLTPDDRETLLGMLQLDAGLRGIVERTPVSEHNVMFTLGELAVLAGHVAAEVNGTKDGRLRKKLERLVERIGRLKATFEEG